MDELTREQAAERLTRYAEAHEDNVRRYGDTDSGRGALALRMGADALARAAEVAERGRPTHERIRALAAEVDNVYTDARYRAPVAELALLATDLLTRVAELEPIVHAFLGEADGPRLTYGEWAELVEHARRAVGAATPAGDGYCGSRSQPHCGKWTVNDTGQWGPSRFVCTKPHGHDGAHHSGYSGWMWTDDDRSPRKDTSQPAADGTGGGDG